MRVESQCAMIDSVWQESNQINSQKQRIIRIVKWREIAVRNSSWNILMNSKRMTWKCMKRDPTDDETFGNKNKTCL